MESTDRLRLAVTHEARAASHELTEKLARRAIIPLRDIGAGATALADERFSKLFDASRLGAPACESGCAYCCYVPRVLVTLPELARIFAVVNTWPVEETSALRKRAERHVISYADAPPQSSPPCPFLVDTRCAVYAVRPIVCRAQHAYSANDCRQFFQSGAGETTQLAVVVDVARGTSAGIADGFRSVGLRDALLELSKALLILLDNPRAMDQWLARGGMLVAAEAAP